MSRPLTYLIIVCVLAFLFGYWLLAGIPAH
jgi:hypothetical protein